MKKSIVFPFLLLFLISCRVNTQNSPAKSITCSGIDLVSIGDNVQKLKAKLKIEYELNEFIEDSSFTIELGRNDNINIIHYNNEVITIGVFCNKYKLSENINIGMSIDSLKIFMPNLEISINHHDSYEYIDYQCNNNSIEILLESKNGVETTIGIYEGDSDITQKFIGEAAVTGFIVKRNSY